MIAVIPARGGSKGVPRKNIQELCGRPLIAHSITAALQCETVEEVYVSTEDAEIAKIAQECGSQILWRESQLATDEATALDVILHAFNNFSDSNSLLYLQPTSPLRRAKDIDAAVSLFAEGDYTSLVSVSEVPHQYTMQKQMRIDGKHLQPCIGEQFTIGNRQVLEKRYARNGPAILITKRKTVASGDLYGHRVAPYIMARRHSIDIDESLDFEFARFLLVAAGKSHSS